MRASVYSYLANWTAIPYPEPCIYALYKRWVTLGVYLTSINFPLVLLSVQGLNNHTTPYFSIFPLVGGINHIVCYINWIG